jgi:hypothetical protein
MNRRLATIALAATLSLILSRPVMAQRGGRGGGGGHVGGGGGGGGFRGGAVGGMHPGGFGGGYAGGFHPGGFAPAAPHFNPGVATRPNINPGNINPGFRPNNINPGFRPNNINQGFVNRPNNININNNNFANNNRIGPNIGYRPYGNGLGYARGGSYNWNRPYWGYHQGWVNGFWPGHYGGWRGYGGYGYGLGGYGWGLGTGLLAGLAIGNYGGWGLNPYSYGWGYSNYSNPFYGYGGGGYGGVGAGGGVGATSVIPTTYNYGVPLDTTAAPPSDDVIEPAMTAFDSAREAFKQGDYNRALSLVDQAIKVTPNDADAHEFRGVTLFALGQYKEAAAALYTVLSAGPGWDWTTLISLYPSVEPYTQQLRALEAARSQNPNDPAARFVLAYLYTCQGATDAAQREYNELVKLLPKDQLIARLARIVSGDKAPPEDVPPANPAPDQGAAPSTEPAGNLNGTWKASPGPDASIGFTRNPDGTFTWDVTNKGQSKPIKGESSYQNGILTLTQADGPPLVGKVTWQGQDKFNFKLLGNGPEDPGLTFSK